MFPLVLVKWHSGRPPNAAPVGGGEPILSADGSVLGAVGVSGVSPELDRACALEGLTAAIASEK